MPKPRAAKLETPTARRKLAVRKKPYWTTISPGIHLGYRRNQGGGTWSVRVADSGAEWIARPAAARRSHRRKPPSHRRRSCSTVAVFHPGPRFRLRHDPDPYSELLA